MKRDNSIPVQSDQMLELCKELWKDYQTRIVDYESLQIESYTRKFEVTKFPKALIAPILLKRTEPISDDAKSLRVEINKYARKQRHFNSDEFKAEREADKLEEKEAIAILKKKGYRVMKRTIAYIDL
jgi:hypothetical protein